MFRPTAIQLRSMRSLEKVGYSIVSVNGWVVLERGDNILNISEEKYSYQECEVKEFEAAERIYTHLHKKGKIQ